MRGTLPLLVFLPSEWDIWLCYLEYQNTYICLHTCMPALWRGEALWHFFGSVVHVSSALCCSWINGCEMIYLGYLPPEHRRSTSTFPPSLLFMHRWRRDKSGQSSIASSWVPSSHKYFPILQFRLLFSGLSLIHVCFSDILGNMSEVALRIADSLTFSADVCSVIRWKWPLLHANNKRRLHRGSSTQGDWLGARHLDHSSCCHLQATCNHPWEECISRSLFLWLKHNMRVNKFTAIQSALYNLCVLCHSKNTVTFNIWTHHLITNACTNGSESLWRF